MKRKRAGFTLIETIMIVFVLGIVVVAGGNLFFSILKGASKAELTKEVKQNGDYAMGIMERMIRNAKRVDSCDDGNSLTITNPDGGTTQFRCLYNATDGIGQIASGSSLLTGKKVTLLSSGISCPASNPSFSCNLGVNPNVVTVNFLLYYKGSSTRPEERAQAAFQTTISLRTY